MGGEPHTASQKMFNLFFTIHILNYTLHIVHWMVDILKWLLPAQHTCAFSLSIAQVLHSKIIKVHSMATRQQRTPHFFSGPPLISSFLTTAEANTFGPRSLISGRDHTCHVCFQPWMEQGSLSLRMEKCKNRGLHRDVKSYRSIKYTNRHFAL